MNYVVSQDTSNSLDLIKELDIFWLNILRVHEMIYGNESYKDFERTFVSDLLNIRENLFKMSTFCIDETLSSNLRSDNVIEI